MPRKSWHSRIVTALNELADNNFKNFERFYPYKVHINADHRCLFYKPDAIWYQGKNSPNIVIWEVENRPSCKAVAGDVALAALCKSRFADWYNEREIGRELRKTKRINDWYDSRMIGREIPAGSYHFKGDEIHRLYFFTVFRNIRYYKRYVDVMIRRQRGRVRPFHKVECFTCDATNVKSARRSLSRRLESIL